MKRILKTPRPPEKALGWTQGHQRLMPPPPDPARGLTVPGCAPAAPRSAPRRWLRGAEPALPAAAAATVPPCSAKTPPGQRSPPPATNTSTGKSGGEDGARSNCRQERSGWGSAADRAASPGGTGAPPPPASKLCPERRLTAGRGRSFLLTGDDEQQRCVEHQVTEGAEEPPISHLIYVGCGRGPGSGRSRARLNPSHTAGPRQGSFPKKPKPPD